MISRKEMAGIAAVLVVIGAFVVSVLAGAVEFIATGDMSHEVLRRAAVVGAVLGFVLFGVAWEEDRASGGTA